MPLNRPIPKISTDTVGKSLTNDGISLSWKLIPNFTVGAFSEYTVTAAGSQAITLPVGTEGVFDVQMMDSHGGVLSIYHNDISMSSNNLLISANAGLKVGDKINGKFYINSSSTVLTSLPNITPADYNKVLGLDATGNIVWK